MGIFLRDVLHRLLQKQTKHISGKKQKQDTYIDHYIYNIILKLTYIKIRS